MIRIFPIPQQLVSFQTAQSIMQSLYLDLLDDTLRSAVRDASLSFVEAQTRFVAERQQPDGGFRGRQGGSDAYYSDFALRCLTLLAPDHPAWEHVKDYVALQSPAPRTVVECFSILNMCRMLLKKGTGSEPEDACAAENGGREVPVPLFQQAAGSELGATGSASATGVMGGLSTRRKGTGSEPEGASAAEDSCREVPVPFLQQPAILTKHLLPTGGLSRSPGDRCVSAYQTFLGALSFSLLGIPMPNVDATIQAIRSLQRRDGGFAERNDQAESQTNATAAAVAFLTMHDAIASEETNAIVSFLAAMQSADGGLQAHAAAFQGDLLSTFTGLVTLKALDRLAAIDTARAARFLQRAALPEGGFTACAGDTEADVEYTYYGLGVFALLRTP